MEDANLSNTELSILINKMLIYLASRSKEPLKAKQVTQRISTKLEKGRLSESMMSTLRKKDQTVGDGKTAGHYENLRREVVKVLMSEFGLIYNIIEPSPNSSDGTNDFEIVSSPLMDRKTGFHLVCYTWKNDAAGSGLSMSILSLFPERPRDKSPQKGTAELLTLETSEDERDPDGNRTRQLGKGEFEIKEKMLYVDLKGLSNESIYRNYLVVQFGTNPLANPQDSFFYGTFSGIRRHGAPSCGVIVLKYLGKQLQDAKRHIQQSLEEHLKNDEFGLMSSFLYGKRTTVNLSPGRVVTELPGWKRFSDLRSDHSGLYCGYYVNAGDGNFQRCLLHISDDGRSSMVTKSSLFKGFFRLFAKNEVLVGGFDRDDDDFYRFRINLLANYREEAYLRGTYSGTESTVAKPNGGRIIFVKVVHIFEWLPDPTDEEKSAVELIKKGDDASLRSAFQQLQRLPSFQPHVFRHTRPYRLEENIPSILFKEIKNYLLGKMDFENEIMTDSQDFFGDSPEFFKRIGWLSQTVDRTQSAMKKYAGAYRCYVSSNAARRSIVMIPFLITTSGEVKVKNDQNELVSGYAEYEDGKRLSIVFKDRIGTSFLSVVVERLSHEEITLAYGILTRQNSNDSIIASQVVLQPTLEKFEMLHFTRFASPEEIRPVSDEQLATKSILEYLGENRSAHHIRASLKPNSVPMDPDLILFHASCQEAKANPGSHRWLSLLEQALEKGSIDIELIEEKTKIGSELYDVRDEVYRLITSKFPKIAFRLRLKDQKIT